MLSSPKNYEVVIKGEYPEGGDRNFVAIVEDDNAESVSYHALVCAARNFKRGSVTSVTVASYNIGHWTSESLGESHSGLNHTRVNPFYAWSTQDQTIPIPEQPGSYTYRPLHDEIARVKVLYERNKVTPVADLRSNPRAPIFNTGDKRLDALLVEKWSVLWALEQLAFVLSGSAAVVLSHKPFTAENVADHLFGILSNNEADQKAFEGRVAKTLDLFIDEGFINRESPTTFNIDPVVLAGIVLWDDIFTRLMFYAGVLVKERS